MEPGLPEFLSFLKSISFLASLAAVPITGAVIGGLGLKLMYYLAPSGIPISPNNIDFSIWIAEVGGFLVGLYLLPRIYRRLYKW